MRTPPMDLVMRLFKIITLVSGRPEGMPLGRPQLARECGLSKRQLQRDINDLEEHVGLRYDRQERAYVLPDKKGRFPVVPLTLAEVAALALVRSLLSAPGLPHRKLVLSALDKATACLSPALRSRLEEASASLQIPTLPRSYAAAPLIALMDAARDRHTVRVDYHSNRRGERMWRSIDPYKVEPRAGVYWELHGWCHENKTLLTFALDRIYGLETLPETFTRDEAAWRLFQEQHAIGGLRGDYSVAAEVRFAPEVAGYARKQAWAGSLFLTDAPDGAVWLRGSISSVEGMVVELLRWRRHVFVRGGAELRAAFEGEIAQMAQNSQKDFAPP